MKRYSLLYAAVFAVFGIISCQKDMDVVSDNSEQTSTELTFGIKENSFDTKTDLYGAITVNWSAGDKILVNCKSGFETFTLKEGAGTRAGVFSINKDVVLNNDGEWSQLAVYPETLNPEYHGVDGDHPTAGWYITLPDSYDWSASRSIKAPMRTYQTKTTDELQVFTTCTGILKVDISDIPATANKLVFTADGLRVSGELYLNDGSHAVAAVSGATKNTITINFPAGSPSTKTFLIPVPEATYSQFTLQFYVDSTPIAGAGKKGKNLTVTNNQIVYLHAFSCDSTPSQTPETVIWEGEYFLGDNWNYNISVFNAAFWAGAKTGQTLTISGHTSSYADAENSIWTYRAIILSRLSPWQALTDGNKNIEFSSDANLPYTQSVVLTANDVADLKAGGLAITGTRVYIDKITIK